MILFSSELFRSLPKLKVIFSVSIIWSVFSGGGGCFLYLLAAIPQPALDVRSGHPVWRLDPPPPAGEITSPPSFSLDIIFTLGTACVVHGLRSLLLLQLHSQSHPLQYHVQEVQARFQWHLWQLQAVQGKWSWMLDFLFQLRCGQVARNSEDSSQKMAEFNMVNLAKREPRWESSPLKIIF